MEVIRGKNRQINIPHRHPFGIGREQDVQVGSVDIVGKLVPKIQSSQPGERIIEFGGKGLRIGGAAEQVLAEVFHVVIIRRGEQPRAVFARDGGHGTARYCVSTSCDSRRFNFRTRSRAI